ncbi:MAG TPA: magnesium transporter [Longimicrobiales bacterium]|nr:magnesium transporter [Longimicrobiales bacterium]
MAEKTELDLEELTEVWGLLSPDDRLAGFRLLDPGEAEEFFFDLSARDQYELLLALPTPERRLWLRTLAPDDAADVVQEAEDEERGQLLGLLDEPTRREVSALLAYEEDAAGGLMSSRFARLRPEMTVDEAISYLRRQALSHIDVETIYYIYVLDQAQQLTGVVSFRELFSERGDLVVRDVMRTDFVTVPEEMDQEAVARVMADNDIVAVPVVDAGGRMVGIVTVDDIVDVVEEEATEDVQKYAGMAALEEPYLRTNFFELIRKRVGWLSLLLVGEMLTASVMAYFEGEMQRALFLTTFVPLIISSGGNSGSQASTLVIRALTLSEIRLRDWWRVMRRELAAGLTLGSILGAIGFFRVIAWDQIFPQAYPVVPMGVTVFFSLTGVVIFGTLAGSMLPLGLQRLKFDPASASAPMVATLVDVMGLVIYFTVASLLVL